MYQYSVERVGGIMRSGDYMPIVTIQPDTIKKLEEAVRKYGDEHVGVSVDQAVYDVIEAIDRAVNE